jgi:hypothetical protein
MHTPVVCARICTGVCANAHASKCAHAHSLRACVRACIQMRACAHSLHACVRVRAFVRLCVCVLCVRARVHACARALPVYARTLRAGQVPARQTEHSRRARQPSHMHPRYVAHCPLMRTAPMHCAGGVSRACARSPMVLGTVQYAGYPNACHAALHGAVGRP